MLGMAFGVGGMGMVVAGMQARKPPVLPSNESQLAPGLVEVLDALNAPSVVVGPDDVVVRSSGAAHVMGLVRADRVVPATLTCTSRTPGTVTPSHVTTTSRPREMAMLPPGQEVFLAVNVNVTGPSSGRFSETLVTM